MARSLKSYLNLTFGIERCIGAMDRLRWSTNIGTGHAEQEHGLYPLTAKILDHGYYLKDLQKMPTRIQVLQ
uniref:Uncharacterized protein n=1 Tax=Arundo donax TaxID=35708 RepID=A0A0A9DDN8_ARUDO